MSDGHILLASGAGSVATADTAALSFTQGFDARVLVALDDWAQATAPTFVEHWDFSTNQRSWLYQRTGGATGRLQMLRSVTGANPVEVSTGANYTPSSGAGSERWMRLLYRASSGTVEFFSSEDNQNWTARGSGAFPPGTIHDSNAPIRLAEQLVGKLYAAELRNHNGVLVANPDFRTDLQYNGTTFIDSFGNEWVLLGDATRVSPTGGVAPTHEREVGTITHGLVVP